MDRTGDCECRSAQYARAHLAADRQESGFKRVQRRGCRAANEGGHATP